MTTKHPRINVTFDAKELEIIKALAEQKKISQSALIKQMVLDWIEEYEDNFLVIRAEKLEKEWESQGQPTTTHEDLCKKLGIQ